MIIRPGRPPKAKGPGKNRGADTIEFEILECIRGLHLSEESIDLEMIESLRVV
jgi:hypothetical protein